MFQRQAGKATKCTPRKRDRVVWRERKASSSLITQRYKLKGTHQSLAWPAQQEKEKSPVRMRHMICHRWNGRSKLLRERSLSAERSKTVKTSWCPSSPTIFRDYHIFAVESHGYSNLHRKVGPRRAIHLSSSPLPPFPGTSLPLKAEHRKEF